MIYGYCRVSSKGQLDGNGLEAQKNEILEKYPNAEIVQEQFTGKTTERPQFLELISKLKENDTLVVTKLDRFCRSTDEGLQLIKDLQSRKVDIHILNMGLIENTPMGELIVTNLLAFAQFERAMIIERTQAGKAIAKQNPNFCEGRPVTHKREKVNHALDLIETGNSYKKVAEMMDMSESTLYRAMRKRKAERLKDCK